MDPFLAEIRMMAFSFPPKGWAFCDGQILPLSQNTALFSLLGTVYGGNGQTTFALPDMQGVAPMHPGQGPGLSARVLGETGGESAVTLLDSEMPAHAHAFNATNSPADVSSPTADTALARSTGKQAYATGAPAPLQAQALPPAGGSLPHNNLMPYLTVSFCIALQGAYPQRP